MEVPLLFTTTVLAVCLILFAIEYRSSMRRYTKLQEENKRILADTNREISKLLENAVASSEALMDQSRIKAQEIISETKFFTDQMQHRLEAHLEAEIKDQLQDFETKFEESNKQLTEMLQSISKDISNKSTVEIQKFVEKLSTNLEKEALLLKSKMEEYEKTIYAKVDQNVFEILDEVSQKTIGKSIDYKEHEQLVTKALQEAKHDRFIE